MSKTKVEEKGSQGTTTSQPEKKRLCVNGKPRPVVACPPLGSKDEPGAQQQFRDNCDINVIMRKYADHGIMPPANEVQAIYGDFSDVGDYQTQLNRIIATRELFDSLPAELRARFNNDPANLLAFVKEPLNDKEAEALGLKEPKSVPPKQDSSPAEPTKQ